MKQCEESVVVHHSRSVHIVVDLCVCLFISVKIHIHAYIDPSHEVGPRTTGFSLAPTWFSQSSPCRSPTILQHSTFDLVTGF